MAFTKVPKPSTSFTAVAEASPVIITPAAVFDQVVFDAVTFDTDQSYASIYTKVARGISSFMKQPI